jgi:predicted RecA/RadA family phage recombinase
MQQPTITLTVQQGSKRGQRFSVAKDSIVIGRMMGNDVVISDPEVSRRHASITWERGQPILRDLGSTNGTFVNDVRLTRPQALSDGDTIGLGKVQLGFQCPALAEARPTVARPSPPPAYVPPPALPAEVERGPGGFSWTALGLFGLAVVILLVVGAVGAYFYSQRGEQVAGVPTVVINSPPSGSQVSVGQEVVVQATATDSRGVTRVELLVNGVLYHSDASLNSQGQSPFISRQSWQASAAGTYTLMVKAYNAAGGVSQPAVININVTGVATPTPGEPTATPTPGEPTATPTMTSTPVPDTPTATWTPIIIVVTETPTPTPTGCTLDAAFVADVTVPDGTVFEPGARIDKIWRVRNSGSCPWQSGYTWMFVSGDQMGSAASQAVPATAAGGNVDIGVTMYAPAAPGTYTGYWRMKSSDGQVFGQTSSVRIVVSSPATATPTATPTSPPLPGAEISLTVDRDHINAGECTWVKARVEYVRAAWLDGEPLIGGYKEKQVCPCNDTTYTLHVELTDGSTTDRTVTVHVSGVCPSPAVYDLYVKRMDFSPANPAVIDTISLSIMIATDTYPSGGPFFPASHFRWRKGPGFDWQEEFCPENTQYASCAKTVQFKYSQVGWYDVEVQADNRNEVAETDEGNNVKVWTLTVSP